MSGELRSLGRETMVYGLSTVVGRLLNFALTPLYTHWMLPADYGVVSTAFPYLAFLNVVYAYGLDFAYMRYAAVNDDSKKEFSTAFWALAGTAGVLSSILFLGAEPVSRAVGLEGYAELVRAAAGIVALDTLALVPFGELRLRHQAFAFAGIKTTGIVVNIVLNFILVGGLRMGPRGVFLASLAASSATLALLGPVIASRLRPVFDRGLALQLAKFGLPLVPAGLASMVVQVIDRPILKAMTDFSTVGLYQANYRLGIFMMMVVNMFDAAWRPFFLQKAGRPDAPELFAKILTYFCVGSTFVVLTLSLFIGDIVALPVLWGKPLIHPSYWAGLGVVPVVLTAYLFNGLYVNFLAPVTLAKRTDLIAYAAGTGAFVNVVVNLALIPKWGIMGAAWATLAAYVAMAAALWLWGRALYPVPYEWGKLAHLAAVTLGLGWAGSASDSGWVRALLCAAHPLSLLATWFFKDFSLPR